MSQKEKIKKYITSKALNIKNEYGFDIPQTKIDEIINRFINSNKEYSQIITEIDNIAQEYLTNNLHNQTNFKQIKLVLSKIQKILESTNTKTYIAGGIVPYLLLNEDSNRHHSDIDFICPLQDMTKLRNIFKQASLYKNDWDSLSYAKDNKDYGFEIIIDGIPVGIYPFTYKDKKLMQYSYDPNRKMCKIKLIKLENISDYITSYKSKDGQTYNTMSLEFIKMTKDHANRPKDIIDSKKITETNLLREDVLNRIQMYQEIQNIKASDLNEI